MVRKENSCNELCSVLSITCVSRSLRIHERTLPVLLWPPSVHTAAAARARVRGGEIEGQHTPVAERASESLRTMEDTS